MIEIEHLKNAQNKQQKYCLCMQPNAFYWCLKTSLSKHDAGNCICICILFQFIENIFF